MLFRDFFEIVLSPVFLIMIGLVGAFFLPMLASIYVTWMENGEQMEHD